jgi:leucyl aminopeptidase (aminopeptidase T)
VVALPTPHWAHALQLPYETLVGHLLPALLAPVHELQQEIERFLGALGGRSELVLSTGAGCKLHLSQGERPWLKDDGVIDGDDRQRGAVVSNLPAGSAYTTVLESETTGDLWLPQAGEARDLTLHFEQGRVVDIQAGRGAQEFRDWLFSHSGEPGRVSHIGVGLNPHLRCPIGWEVPVDEHVHGSIFLALGENRYMGGQNASDLNHDFVIHQASLLANGKEIVREGKVIA